MDALSRAIAHFGTQAALAKRLDVKPMTVSQWKRRGIPAERVLQIEEATGGLVTRHELRSDLYPVEPKRRSA